MAAIVLEPQSPMLDIINPDEEIKIELRADRQVLWVNVDGVCRFRIQRIDGKPINLVGFDRLTDVT